ncbi:unnamed protein product, partial [Lymnaea stagnalis]
ANLILQERRLGSASAELSAAQKTLDEKQAELNIVQAKYDGAMAKKRALLEDAQACQRRMDTASTLISGLGGEQIRW